MCANIFLLFLFCLPFVCNSPRFLYLVSPFAFSPTFFSSFIPFSFFLLSHGQLINPFNSSSNLSHLPSPVKVVGFPSRFLLFLLFFFYSLTFLSVRTSNNLSFYVALLSLYIVLSFTCPKFFSSYFFAFSSSS